MNIQQLRIAFEVSKTGSISRAAANLFLSQSNASNNIKALELDMITQSVKNNGLKMEFIRNIPFNINLREGHPLLADGKEPDISKLSHYPYVTYSGLPGILEAAGDTVDSTIGYRLLRSEVSYIE